MQSGNYSIIAAIFTGHEMKGIRSSHHPDRHLTVSGHKIVGDVLIDCIDQYLEEGKTVSQYDE